MNIRKKRLGQSFGLRKIKRGIKLRWQIVAYESFEESLLGWPNRQLPLCTHLYQGLAKAKTLGVAGEVAPGVQVDHTNQLVHIKYPKS